MIRNRLAMKCNWNVFLLLMKKMGHNWLLSKGWILYVHDDDDDDDDDADDGPDCKFLRKILICLLLLPC